MAQRKMVSLSVEETSGVDHPAHLHEGWVIIKQADAAGVADVIDTLAADAADDLEDTMPETEKSEELTAIEAELAKANERIAELEALVAEAAAPAEETIVEPTEEDLIKSAPEAVRVALEKAREEADSVREELRKEREARLDREFVEKAAGWSNLTIDTAEFGPMLRRLTDAAPELAAALEKALSALDAQAESAAIFEELGTSPRPDAGDSFGRVESLAKAAVAAGEYPTIEQAVTAVIAKNPDLYHSYLAEKRG